MARHRPAGESDDDSDFSDYDGFCDDWHRNTVPVQQQNVRKTIEIALQDAIINGNVQEVEKIINSDLQNNVNMKLDSGWTPLMHACFHAQENIVELLLNLGADPNLHADSVTPVMAACSNSSANKDIIFSIITKLIEKNCILNIGDKYGQTPLMRAIGSGCVAVVQKLLDQKVNIEMRDQQGWTALFWAAHHNQPEILEMLIEQGARLTEVDRSNRTVLDIALAHEHQSVIEILNNHLKTDDNEVEKTYVNNQIMSWLDFYPGVNKGEKPDYRGEIPQLLYGMNCDRLIPLFDKSDIDLKTFLLLEEDDMIKLGITMPFERQRLRKGIRNFHTRGWKLNSVSGLYAQKIENYSVLDCLTSLGSHLQQTYVLDASLQYVLREYSKMQNQIKFEPSDSPILTKLKVAANKMLTNINSIRNEIKIMKIFLKKVSRNNPPPADLIKVKTRQEIILGYVSEVLVLCSLGLAAYHARGYVTGLLKR